MTRPLRRAHLRTWIVLAVVLPILFALAITVRQSTTTVNRQLLWEEYP